MPAPTPDELDIQGAWDPVPLRAQWPMGLDNAFTMRRLADVPVEEILADAAGGRLLEVAAAEARHSCRLAARGFECHVVEPGEEMLASARANMAAQGVHLHLVRAIAEALPYPDHHFDRVLIDSAMDHLAAPDTGLREMIRVLKPDGRLIVSFVNYGSLAVRLSRALYAVDRLRPGAPEFGRFWDSPVPHEHTFECTYRNIGRLFGQYLELDRAVGVSLLWGTPGWAPLLGALERGRAERLLQRLDALARRVPGLADFVLMVWRPRAPGETPGGGLRALAPLARLTAATPAPPPRRVETLRVTPADPIYQARAATDLEWEENWWRAAAVRRRMAGGAAMANRALTGDPSRSAIDAFAARGPFGHAALLGGDGEDEAEAWLRAGGSQTLDVIEASPARLARLRAQLAGHGERARLQQQDLNFLALPRAHYDAVIAAGGLVRLLNLEFLFDEIAQALRPGGLLAVASYVGERRQAYAPARLALVNAALAEIPARLRFDAGEGIAPADPERLAPYRAVRSDEILAVARARFELVEERLEGRLFPLFFHVDVPALEREEPALLARLLNHERALAADPAATPCMAYLVLRRR